MKDWLLQRETGSPSSAQKSHDSDSLYQSSLAFSLKNHCLKIKVGPEEEGRNGIAGTDLQLQGHPVCLMDSQAYRLKDSEVMEKCINATQSSLSVLEIISRNTTQSKPKVQAILRGAGDCPQNGSILRCA